MRRTHRAIVTTALGAMAASSMTGCLHRRIFIASDPPGATVHLNDVEVGRTPVEVDFTYFGVYDVRLSKPGYEPIVTSENAKAPVYEWPGIDLIAEAIPADITTEIRWSYTLMPVDNDIDSVLERARELRDDLGDDR
ncbi:MAG: PEGA domain-containing protein [Phycisphaeraceae bacterium]|nr:PEGA domain-containing protein [Phycisphaeraceae bacterium]MCB9846976.1 PEGA domain-containing protein [Phycisphaeraceae bacterium]